VGSRCARRCVRRQPSVARFECGRDSGLEQGRGAAALELVGGAQQQRYGVGEAPAQNGDPTAHRLGPG